MCSQITEAEFARYQRRIKSRPHHYWDETRSGVLAMAQRLAKEFRFLPESVFEKALAEHGIRPEPSQVGGWSLNVCKEQ